MFRNTSIAISASLIISGCASVQHVPLTEELSQGLEGKSVIATQYEKPDFSAFTAEKAALGPLGAVAMTSAGNDIVDENKIEDPALAISEGLAERMKLSRNVEVKHNLNTTASNDEVAGLISEFPSADYILDVKTMNWMFNYYPSDWNHYIVTYNARMRLIDANEGKVIAETMCSSAQGDDENPPTEEDLLNNNAELLKLYLDKASTVCVDALSTQILKL